LVEIRFAAINTLNECVYKRSHVQQINVAAQVDVTQQGRIEYDIVSVSPVVSDK
jgi:hypothetical protein